MEMENAQGYSTASKRGFATSCIGWIGFLLALIGTPLTAQSQTLHALLVIMDADLSLGTVMKANQTKVTQLLTTVEETSALRVAVQTRLSSRNEATKAGVIAWFEALNPSDDDVVLLYFSGYGGADEGTHPEAFVFLQDGILRHAALAQQLQSMGKCRFKILITDACNGVLAATPLSKLDAPAPDVQKAQMENLFINHKGVLHLTSATAPEIGWATLQGGGLFTSALVDAFATGVMSWAEIFDATRQTTADRFQRAYANLPEAMKATLHRSAIENQTPKAYALPSPDDTPPANPGESPTATLWELSPSEAGFTVSLETDKTDYQLNDYLTFSVEVTADAHLVILNWDAAGHLRLILPNSLQPEMPVEARRRYMIPDKHADFDFSLPGPPGTEKNKLIALRHAKDSENIINFLPETDKLFRHVQGKQQAEVEQRIVTYLSEMNPGDWAETHREVIIRKVEHLETDTPPNGQPVVNTENIYYFKDEHHMYFARVMDPLDETEATGQVAVHIFNDALREKLGETIPVERLIAKRTEPQQGWGNRLIMLSFYRDGEWHHTFDAVVFETYYRLPERIDRKPVQGPRKVGFGEVRIAIPVSYDKNEP